MPAGRPWVWYPTARPYLADSATHGVKLLTTSDIYLASTAMATARLMAIAVMVGGLDSLTSVGAALTTSSDARRVRLHTCMQRPNQQHKSTEGTQK